MVKISILLYFFVLSLIQSSANSARETPNPIPPPVPVLGPTFGPNTANALTLSLFMHDILGGSAPSVRVVAGLIDTTQVNGIPFSKPNGGVFPISNGVPLLTANNGVKNVNRILHSGNLPLIAGLNGASTTTVVSNNAVTSGNTLPFVAAGQLPISLQSLMFGTITVIDDELTKGHELGSAVVGRAKGFYLASSLHGSRHTMAFTVLLHGGDHHHDDVDDTISFFGVHRTAGMASSIAVVGGTGKYEDARGHTMIETVHLTDQHMTDGVETVLQLSVFLI